MVWSLIAVAAATSDPLTTAASWIPKDQITIIGFVIILFGLMVRGTILTRKTADAEKQSIVDGQTALASAHTEILAYKDQHIESLIQEKKLLEELMVRREEQLGRMIDEFVPSFVAWTQATEQAAGKVLNGGDDSNGLANS